MIELNVNGHAHRISAAPDTPLLYVLREDLKLNAAKFGCGLGQCGSCTVLIDGTATLSCVTPILLLEGRQITTLEGLGTREHPAPIQQAFIEEQAAQCGFCIPGMMMRAQELLERNPHASEDEIRKQLEPNLCRCGTHLRILRAVRRAAALLQSNVGATTEAGPARKAGQPADSRQPAQVGALQPGQSESARDTVRHPVHPEQRERPER